VTRLAARRGARVEQDPVEKAPVPPLVGPRRIPRDHGRRKLEACEVAADARESRVVAIERPDFVES